MFLVFYYKTKNHPNPPTHYSKFLEWCVAAGGFRYVSNLPRTTFPLASVLADLIGRHRLRLVAREEVHDNLQTSLESARVLEVILQLRCKIRETTLSAGTLHVVFHDSSVRTENVCNAHTFLETETVYTKNVHLLRSSGDMIFQI